MCSRVITILSCVRCVRQAPKRFGRVMDQFAAISEEIRPAMPALCILQLAPSGALKSWLPDHLAQEEAVQVALGALGKALQDSQANEFKSRRTDLLGALCVCELQALPVEPTCCPWHTTASCLTAVTCVQLVAKSQLQPRPSR